MVMLAAATFRPISWSTGLASAGLRVSQLGETRDQPYILTVPGGLPFHAPVIKPEPVKEPAAVLPHSPVIENLTGMKISHYRVLQLLGARGMGVVYQAEDLKLGRQVAM
jgi:serine/threonine protein kinase